MKKLLKILIPIKERPFFSFLFLRFKFLTFWLIETVFLIKQTIPLPPPKLRFRVHGGIVKPKFLVVGQKSFSDICSALESVDYRLEDFQGILDWGCGCGRVLRYLLQTDIKAEIFGCDIDKELVDWCNEHLPQGEYKSVRSVPPLPYQTEQFDFIYGISVLTHLDEKMQFLWLDELKRVMKPGAIIILTVHGRNVYEQLPQEKMSLMKSRGCLFEIGQTGKFKLDGLPDFYQTSYHTKDYITQNWSSYFGVLKVIERGMNNHQDVIVLRKT